MEHWEAHFKFYDLFQMNYSKYRFMLDFHRKALKRSFLILDSGAGTGNLTLELLKEKHQVVAIDNNEPALKILLCKCKLYKDNLQIIRQDLKNNGIFSISMGLPKKGVMKDEEIPSKLLSLNSSIFVKSCLIISKLSL